MSSQPPDPFDQSPPDSFSPSAADQIDPYPSDPAEPTNHSPGYTNPLAIGSLVSALISVLLVFSCVCCPPVSLVGGVTSILAIVLGLIAIRQTKAGKGTGGGLAMVGIILGVVVLLLIVAVIGWVAVSRNNNFNDLEWLERGQLKEEAVPVEDILELNTPELIPVEPEMDGATPAEPDGNPPPSEPPTPTPKTPDDGTPDPPGL